MEILHARHCAKHFSQVSSLDPHNNLYKVNKPLISYFKQMFNISKDEIAATLDVILPALHGTNCEDGSFQGAVEMTGIPYAGIKPRSPTLQANSLPGKPYILDTK